MKKLPIAVFAGMSVVAAASSAIAQEPVFGGELDVAFAEKLWTALEEARLVGKDSIRALPVEGTEPHGQIVMTLQGDVTVDEHKGDAIVKTNYLGPNATVEYIATNPRENLNSITVMYRREAGYDPENKNWFWVKYGPGGAILENQKHAKLAGRVGKDADLGCLACHKSAPGGDLVFIHDTFSDER